jgi:hypothetical protein
MITGKNLKDALCTLSLGTAPSQTIDLKAFEEKIDKKAKAKQASLEDFDEDFYGNDSYNPDEFDNEGFDEMTFDDKY